VISLGNSNNLEKYIKDGKNWLIESGIQNLDSNSLEIKGGFNSWYDLDNKNYFYAYSEVAGYAISTLLFLNSIDNKDLYLLRSILAAEWLLDKASHKSGGLKTRYYFNRESAPEQYDFSSGVIHSFDNGIALSGLIDLYNKTKEKRYLNTAEKIGNFLVELMQKEDGSLYASYSHKDEKLKDEGEKWSTQSGSYHAKMSIGFLKLYKLLKNDKYKEATIKLCNKSLDFQEENGRFISYKKEKDTHIHPHCYSLEGLLYSGLYFNNEKYLESVTKGTKWALDIQMKNGGIPSMYVNNKIVEFERSDVLAQTLRLGTIMISLGFLDKNYEKNLAKLKDRLISFQYKSKSNDIKSNGGFLFGYDVDYRNNLNSSKKNHLNSWCTIFTLQSLIFYDDYLKGKFNFDKDKLI
jgi:hypothetical protein